MVLEEKKKEKKKQHLGHLKGRGQAIRGPTNGVHIEGLGEKDTV